MTEMAGKIACDFCGKHSGQVRRLIAGVSVDTSGKIFRGTLCSECLATFMKIVAVEDREWFDREIEEARKFKPDYGE